MQRWSRLGGRVLKTVLGKVPVLKPTQFPVPSLNTSGTSYTTGACVSCAQIKQAWLSHPQRKRHFLQGEAMNQLHSYED